MRSDQIFLSYMGGSGGRFLASMIHAIAGGLELQDRRDGHYSWSYQYDAEDPPTRDPGPEWFRTHSADLVHPGLGSIVSHNIICTHWLYTQSLLHAIPSCRIIKITYDHDDIDQISYNFFSKNQNNDRWSRQIEKIKEYARTSFFNSIPASGRDRINDDPALLTALYARVLKVYLSQFDLPQEQTDTRVLLIPFRDIFQGQLTDHLPRLAQFVGFDLDPSSIRRATRWAQAYAKKQVMVPWHGVDIIPERALF